MRTTVLARLAVAALWLAAIGPARADGPTRTAQAFAQTADFAVTIVLVTDPVAFQSMWQKPTPPNLRELGPVEISEPVSALIAFAGGRPDAQGLCDLAYTLRIEDATGQALANSDELPLCKGQAPRPAYTLGAGAAIAASGNEPGRYVVKAHVTDRVARTTVDVEAPLLVVASGSMFHFESVASRDDMAAFVRARFKPGATRASVRQVFVTEGRAALRTHPTQRGVEKYLYDVDLCSYYVWRWNISADYDEAGLLRQAYVGGERVLPDGTPARRSAKEQIVEGKSKIFSGKRPRPEAFKGEKSLAYTFLDIDGDPKTIDDQYLIGAGPSRPDPRDMGKLYVYSEVDPWRSIFDGDAAEPIARWRGDCAAVDAMVQARTPPAK